jgi:hypothetical protein
MAVYARKKQPNMARAGLSGPRFHRGVAVLIYFDIRQSAEQKRIVVAVTGGEELYGLCS